jgi:hypothetical protein
MCVCIVGRGVIGGEGGSMLEQSRAPSVCLLFTCDRLRCGRRQSRMGLDLGHRWILVSYFWSFDDSA